jgi:hypothetical protein
VEEDMLGMIPTLNYVFHDITDERKFPELIPSNFLMKSISFETHMML